MKNLIKTIFCAAMLALPMARAMADGGPSISYEQAANVGGVQQKFQNGIGPSDFDAGQIGATLARAQFGNANQQLPYGNALLNIWAMTPDPLRLPLSDYTSKMAISPDAVRITTGETSLGVGVVTRWAAWASEQGLLDFQQFATLYQRCGDMAAAPDDGEYFGRGLHTNYLDGCAVHAYLTAYAVGGFAQKHDLRGLVPLCEVTQANSCGILPDFDPKAALQQYQANLAAKQRDAANQAAYNTMVMHNKAHARYECMKNVPYGTPITSLTPECKIILGPRVAASIEDAEANGGAK